MKMLMNVYALLCLLIVSFDFHDGVNDLDVSTNKSIFFFFCMPNDAYEHMKMQLNVKKNAKIVTESELYLQRLASWRL